MEMHQLRYAVAVARLRNFSRAAESCHVSQPSLSQAVAKLEEELGERIFERGRGGVVVTRQGAAFLERARRILDEVSMAMRDAGEAGGGLRGELRVGVLPTIAPYLLPSAVRAFRASHPEMRILLQEDTTASLSRALMDDEIDLAIVSAPVSEPQVESTVLFDEELLLALPADHPLARRATVSAKMLDDEALLVMKPGHCLGDEVLGFCERHQIGGGVAFRSAQLETLFAMVEAGLGISLVPRMAVGGGGGGIVFRRLRGLRPRRTIVALHPAGRPLARSETAFLALLEPARPIGPVEKSRKKPLADGA
jgi:LysR family transcriptional regulator, hydrogen peroxide-inducible genes activator